MRLNNTAYQVDNLLLKHYMRRANYYQNWSLIWMWTSIFQGIVIFLLTWYR